MQNKKKFKFPLGVTAALAVLCTWMAFVCYSIATEPEKGAGNLQKLQSDVTDAVRNHDADSLQRLFDEDTVGDSYASKYMKRLKEFPVENARTTLTTHLGNAYVILHVDDKRAAFCTSWLIAEKDGRKFLDGSPSGWNACG
ncbi:hypothetical protein ACLQ18_39470 [Streptomyces sp. DT193]|uniref:hypothetical protein n=1 Tax=Streptomyces sp. DT193 TaxID=3393418 RepID=UPI003CECCD62